VLSFDGFTLDLNRGCLFRGAKEEIKLRPKSFEVLRYLAENHGRLISKEELIASVWPQTAVTDDSLVQCLIDVRRALGDTSQRFVKTVPRRGYIFEPAVIRRDMTQEIDGIRPVHDSERDDQSSEPKNMPAVSTTVGGYLSKGEARHKWTSLAILAVVGALLAVSAYFVVPRYFTRARVGGSGRTPPAITSIASCHLRTFRVTPLRTTLPME
jgi:DNA-binding winged helix-turn-helix (wHTH) protein